MSYIPSSIVVKEGKTFFKSNKNGVNFNQMYEDLLQKLLNFC